MDDSSNVYVAPQSDVSVNESKPGAPVKGVIFGVLIDIGGTLIYGMGLGIIWSIFLLSQGMSQEQVVNELQNPDMLSPFMIIASIGGCLISVLAGYVCGRIAKKHEYRLAIILAVIVILVVSIVTGRYQTLIDALLVAATVLSIILGSYFATKKNSQIALNSSQ